MPEYTWKEVAKPELAEAARVQQCRAWLLAGEEAYFREQYQARLVSLLLAEDEREWGLEVLRLTLPLLRGQAPEGSWPRHILTLATTLPFFSPRRVLVVEEAQLLDAKQQEEIAAAIPGLPETAILVLASADSGTAGARGGTAGARGQGPGAGKAGGRTAGARGQGPGVRKTGGKTGGRGGGKTGGGDGERGRGLSKKLSDAVAAHGTVVWFEPLDAEAAIGYVQRMAKRGGKSLDPSAAAMLVNQRLGTGIATLRREMEKLIVYAAGPIITTAHIEAMTPRLLEESVFELSNALSKGKEGHHRALILLRKMLSAGHGPPQILGRLAGQFRLLWQVKGLLENGWRLGDPLDDEVGETVLLRGKDSVAAALKKGGKRAQILSEQARRFTWTQLERSLHAFAEADLELKGMGAIPRGGDEALTLEMMVVGIVRDEGGGMRAEG